jgi:hypothetical protein
MKKTSRFVALLTLGSAALLLSAFAGGCGGGSSSGSGSSGGGPTGFGCNVSIAGSQFCYVFTNLTAQQVSSEQTTCTNMSGTVVTQCPAANRVGCCTVTQTGVTFDECFYFGTVMTDQQACTSAMGTWTSM